MVVTMHYCTTAVIEKHGSDCLRREIAPDCHLSTLAFSEPGSCSHFRAPLGKAAAEWSPAAIAAGFERVRMLKAGACAREDWVSMKPPRHD